MFGFEVRFQAEFDENITNWLRDLKVQVTSLMVHGDAEHEPANLFRNAQNDNELARWETLQDRKGICRLSKWKSLLGVFEEFDERDVFLRADVYELFKCFEI